MDDINKKRFERKLENQNRELSELVRERITREFGSIEAYELELERVKQNKLKNGIIDWYQLPQYFFDRLEGFEDFCHKRIVEGKEDAPLTEYGFLSYFFRVFVKQMDFQLEQQKIQIAFDLLLDVYHKADDSIRNEIMVVVLEDFDPMKNSKYLKPFQDIAKSISK